MAELLRQGLPEEGHGITLAADSREGLGPAETVAIDLILLAVLLPGLDGLQVARQLRSLRNQTPILMLTARDSARDIVEGLDLGADDYLTKPFSFEVLLARVRAVGRRGPIPQPVCLEAAGIVMNQSTREVCRAGHRVELTRTEFAILEVLVRNAGRVVTGGVLIESVWGGNSDIESNTLDAFVRLLRAKIEESKLIRTIRGVGYSLKTEAD
jgi:DNA-binding response OmpR family regulator